MAKEQFYTRKEAAIYLTSIGCPVSRFTLANKAANNNKGNGPEFIAAGWKTVRYSKTALDEWAAQKVVRFHPPVRQMNK